MTQVAGKVAPRFETQSEKAMRADRAGRDGATSQGTRDHQELEETGRVPPDQNNSLTEPPVSEAGLGTTGKWPGTHHGQEGQTNLPRGNNIPHQKPKDESELATQRAQGRGHPESVSVGGRRAAAKSLQSCPTLCDPIDGSPPGSPVPGILQARTVQWVAIFSAKPDG